MKTIYLSFCLVIYVYAKLVILEPENLISSIGSDQILYNMGNIGYDILENNILGEVMLADPIDLCTEVVNAKKENYDVPIILFGVIENQSKCTFSTKTIHAQQWGASLLILFSNESDSLMSLNILVNSATDPLLSIPTIYLTKSTGSAILSTITKNNLTVILEYMPDTLNNMGYASASIWIDAASLQSYQLLEELKDFYDVYAKEINSFAKFNVRFYSNQQKSAKTFEYKKDYPECISSGRYCEFINFNSAIWNSEGKDVMLEDLRQICINDKYSFQVFLEYASLYKKLCLTKKDNETTNITICASEAEKNLNLDSDTIQDCVKSSFNNQISGFPYWHPDNIYMKHMILEQTKLKVSWIPQLYIDNFLYEKQLSMGKFLTEICNSVNYKGIDCNAFSLGEYYIESVDTQIFSTNFLIILSVGILLIIVVNYICWKRVVMKDLEVRRRSLSSDLEKQIKNYYKSESPFEKGIQMSAKKH